MKEKIAIVGAGASACFFSYLLPNMQQDISIFEKIRGIGGRCSVRRKEKFGVFNLGDQFFTIKNPDLAKYFKEIVDNALIENIPSSSGYYSKEEVWEQAIQHPRFVGTPHMNSFPKYWCSEAEVKLNSKVDAITKKNEMWRIETKHGQIFEGFDICVLTVPHPQGRQSTSDRNFL
ncbi:MAG: NAD(P)-binding protein [Oligoflexales bacterium]